MPYALSTGEMCKSLNLCTTLFHCAGCNNCRWHNKIRVVHLQSRLLEGFWAGFS